jgi:glycerol kinase
MMNIGEELKLSDNGLVTSLAWVRNVKVEYVFEGNLNYTGAVITWLKDSIGLISDAGETGALAEEANPEDRTYFVPAFTGLGSPYWDSEATGMFTGITRTTGKKELVKACVECIAYQITDLIELMRKESGFDIEAIRVDGGPTANRYLMQFQSDMANAVVQIPELQELSGMGAAYMAGIAAGIYNPENVYEHITYTAFVPKADAAQRELHYRGWKAAVKQVLVH